MRLGFIVTRAVELSVFGVLPLALTVGTLTTAAAMHGGGWGIEFRGNFWQPAQSILHGRDPYDLARIEADLAGTGPDVGKGYNAQAVYPASAHVAAVPLGLLPFTAAMALFVGLSAASLVGALLLLGVRDWRCYGVVFLSYTTAHALVLGALTPMLVLGCAAAWRFRRRLRPLATSVAALVAAKLFLLPLAVWLVATRRARAAWYALLLAAAAIMAGWAVIGFAGLLTYPRLLELDSRYQDGLGYPLRTVGSQLGLGNGQALAAAVAVALLVGAAVLGRRGNDLGAFALALVGTLALSPIVWQNYFLLLLVPLAAARPRLSPAWLLALSFWLAAREGHGARDELVAWGTVAAVCALAAVAGEHRVNSPSIDSVRQMGAPPVPDRTPLSAL